MADVGAAAGVSRATVYRHFPTRETLIVAIQLQALEQGERALERARLDEGPATEALRRLCDAWLEVSERYAVAAASQALDDETREQRRRLLGDPLRTLIERGQAEGAFSQALSVEWALRAFGALLLAGARAVTDGTLARDEAPDAVFRSLHEGLKA